jgi:zinc/manganese transport system substrate-binding protein
MKRYILFLWCFFAAFCEGNPLQIVVSFSILEDLVRQVGQEKVIVHSIVGRNGDAHVYTPSPLDVQTVRQADLVFINGLGFEGWIERLIQASGFKGRVVVVSKNIHPRLVFEGRLVEDPHAWHSIPNAVVYVHSIRDALVQADPSNRMFYEKNASVYIQRLMQLDHSIRDLLAILPPAHRKIITAHDAFGYFGNAYGVQFLSPVGTNTESEPCAKDMAQLIESIKKYKMKTLFLENITSPRLIQQLARETGAKIGQPLYSDALSLENEPAPTYEAMIKHNVGLFLQAMREMV